MQNSIDFKGVKTATGGSFVEPGVIAVFKVTEVEMIEATDTQKQHLAVTFQGEAEEGTYKEKFFITEKSLPRLKYFIEELTGAVPDGALQISRIKEACIGKLTGLKISGTIGNNGKGYSELGYAGFMCKPENIAELKFSAKEQASVAASLEARAKVVTSSTSAEEESIDDAPVDLDSEDEV